jgi:hypothetical protein
MKVNHLTVATARLSGVALVLVASTRPVIADRGNCHSANPAPSCFSAPLNPAPSGSAPVVSFGDLGSAATLLSGGMLVVLSKHRRG